MISHKSEGAVVPFLRTRKYVALADNTSLHLHHNVIWAFPSIVNQDHGWLGYDLQTLHHEEGDRR